MCDSTSNVYYDESVTKQVCRQVRLTYVTTSMHTCASLSEGCEVSVTMHDCARMTSQDTGLEANQDT